MKPSRKFLINVASLACAAVLLVGLIPVVANAASLPTLGTRLYWILGSLLHGGMIAPASTSLNTTALAGSIEVLPEFLSLTTLKPVTNSTASGFPYKARFNAVLRSTGSNTMRYGVACFPNPFKNVSGGSGVVVRLDYHAGQTNGNGGDIGFVSSCANGTDLDNTASGDTLINNTCTATGCVSSYTTGTATFKGLDYIKFTPRGKVGTSPGRITGEVLNSWYE